MSSGSTWSGLGLGLGFGFGLGLGFGLGVRVRVRVKVRVRVRVWLGLGFRLDVLGIRLPVYATASALGGRVDAVGAEDGVQQVVAEACRLGE